MKNLKKIYRYWIGALLKGMVRALSVTLLVAPLLGKAQNVGIGTDNPQAPLHVAGTIMGNHFQSLGTATINTRLSINAPVDGGYRLYVHGGHTFLGGNLQVENDGIVENNLRVNGRVGINGATNASYGLIVNNSNSYFQGNIIATGTASITGASTLTGAVTTGGNVSVGNNLNVNKDAIITENLRVNGRVGINGPTNANYGLFVNSSNSYFQGNTITTGNAVVQGDLTIKGNGHVRSNGPSNLRVSFMAINVDEQINNGSSAAVVVNTGFTGGNNDIRVLVSQVLPDPGGSVSWQRVNITATSVSNTGTCNLWLNNHSGANGLVKGTVYLTVIGKD